jgi:5-hydroxyisourate hydrolase-like protein (transthyretin family)
MRVKLLLLLTIGAMGCLQSNATGTEPDDPGKSINELAGNIYDADSRKPMKDVTVSAYSTVTNKKEKFVMTDELGRFEFDELKTGIYKLVFEKDGYRRVVKEKINIKADETFQLRIDMVEMSDFDLVPSPFQFFDTK